MLFPLCQSFAELPCKAVKKDDTNIAFAGDKRVLGRWRSVDFVDNISDFDPGNMSFQEDLYLKDLIFYRGGGTSMPGSHWTNGYLINKGDSTVSRYIIKDFNCRQDVCDSYMFLEWKSGDYVCKGLPPKYYVLKKASGVKEDNMDMPFVNDAAVLGPWKTVDFVAQPSLFKPGVRNWQGDLSLGGLAFLPEGAMIPQFNKWTKGFVINTSGKTTSAYTIQNINGTDYMFYEWKSGDYVYRGQSPWYYVLERRQTCASANIRSLTVNSVYVNHDPAAAATGVSSGMNWPEGYLFLGFDQRIPSDVFDDCLSGGNAQRSIDIPLGVYDGGNMVMQIGESCGSSSDNDVTYRCIYLTRDQRERLVKGKTYMIKALSGKLDNGINLQVKDGLFFTWNNYNDPCDNFKFSSVTVNAAYSASSPNLPCGVKDYMEQNGLKNTLFVTFEENILHRTERCVLGKTGGLPLAVYDGNNKLFDVVKDAGGSVSCNDAGITRVVNITPGNAQILQKGKTYFIKATGYALDNGVKLNVKDGVNFTW